ncbi:FtsW/RodA/SpoVE family cell cycle protein [Porphyrobacter sp. GA68]|uniref:FtsW/RodA/SpoVE family cell cycle protein n=1 Tax=Porphyrobacter sp. GA68 TaxID=2883480 RepID=UPI001D18C323|nr:FtsW/RodA/SpoVE family cell cycle protein [Porphyrobacter sp. GA68]
MTGYRSAAAASAAARRPAAASLQAELRIWWREIDRVLLCLVLLLMAIGTVAVAAASPASARRLSTAGTKLPELYFFWQHVVWQMLGMAVLLGVSTLPRVRARRAAVLLAGVMTFFLLLVPVIGVEVNGAHRWIDLGMRFQPSEFLKASFAVTLAWVLSWRARDPNLPVVSLAIGYTALVAALLMMQPDLGSAIVFSGVCLALLFMAGVSPARIGGVVAAGIGALVAAYFLYGNARGRIDSFLGGGTAFDQVDLAWRTLVAGGWTGSGFWLGSRKMSLPEAHTDYIFSVIGEEFGLLVCALVVLLYLAIVVRVLMRAFDAEDLFTLLATSGLGAVLGGQAFINILVNLRLFPSKGMTLPLVSYGGSSTIAICFTVGLLLSLSRRNPHLSRTTPGLARIFGLDAATPPPRRPVLERSVP